MFKVGDKVICIDNDNYDELVLYKTYTIKVKFDQTVQLKEFNASLIYIFRFKLLSDFRKQKIKRICSRLETK
jgi:predicted component of type VI protein secretion system